MPLLYLCLNCLIICSTIATYPLSTSLHLIFMHLRLSTTLHLILNFPFSFLCVLCHSFCGQQLYNSFFNIYLLFYLTYHFYPPLPLLESLGVGFLWLFCRCILFVNFSCILCLFLYSWFFHLFKIYMFNIHCVSLSFFFICYCLCFLISGWLFLLCMSKCIICV